VERDTTQSWEWKNCEGKGKFNKKTDVDDTACWCLCLG
jgi:hypothetical protein